MNLCIVKARRWFNIKMLSYLYRKSPCGDKTYDRRIYTMGFPIHTPWDQHGARLGPVLFIDMKLRIILCYHTQGIKVGTYVVINLSFIAMFFGQFCYCTQMMYVLAPDMLLFSAMWLQLNIISWDLTHIDLFSFMLMTISKFPFSHHLAISVGCLSF